jgi:hypothetical protein
MRSTLAIYLLGLGIYTKKSLPNNFSVETDVAHNKLEGLTRVKKYLLVHRISSPVQTPTLWS